MTTLFGDEHVKRYEETGGAEGHDWQGVPTLILTTRGRRTGEPRKNALIYQQHGDDYVIVGSKGGSDTAPAWYLNLQADPDVKVQVWDDVFPARARTATPGERQQLWPLMASVWPAYDRYQERTQREIPLVILERLST